MLSLHWRPIVHVLQRSRDARHTEFIPSHGLNLHTLQGWEQGRIQPDGPARAYLPVILREPRAVERALAAET